MTGRELCSRCGVRKPFCARSECPWRAASLRWARLSAAVQVLYRGDEQVGSVWAPAGSARIIACVAKGRERAQFPTEAEAKAHVERRVQ
jgi:hypothetical protein